MPPKMQGIGMLFGIVVLLVVGLVASSLSSLVLWTLNAEDDSLKAAQVQLAAQAGIEWAKNNLYRGNISCQDNTPFTVSLPATVFPSIVLSVWIPCTFDANGNGYAQYTENSITYNRFGLVATATSGTFGNAHYVSRQVMETYIYSN